MTDTYKIEIEDIHELSDVMTKLAHHHGVDDDTLLNDNEKGALYLHGAEIHHHAAKELKAKVKALKLRQKQEGKVPPQPLAS